ncbi:MAG: hypothetical protein AMXMBFR13_38930 [Phycisphaerae bacterium]
MIQSAAQKALETPPPSIPACVPGYNRLVFSDHPTETFSIYSDEPTPPEMVEKAKVIWREGEEITRKAAGGDVSGLLVFRVVNGEVEFDLSPLTEDLRCYAIQWHLGESMSRSFAGQREQIAARNFAPEIWEFVAREIALRATVPCDERILTAYAHAVHGKEIPPPSLKLVTAEMARLDRDGFTEELLQLLWRKYPVEAERICLPKPGKPDEQTEATHSPDFTSVRWFGRVYQFAKGNQAQSVQILWEAWEEGHTLSESKIAELIDASPDHFRLSKVFRKKKLGGGYEPHEAWGTMIRAVRKGVFGLSRPESSENPT